MKAFKLLEFDKRPMKIKGSKVIAATVIPLTADSLVNGHFVALPSGKKVELKSGGMLAKGSHEAKEVFSLMKARGASLSENLLELDNPVEEVFVEESVATSVTHFVFEIDSVRPELQGYWIPGVFVVAYVVVKVTTVRVF